ncbi:glycosyltransferase family 4 protein [Opitutales bacterium]|jgi:colanic acid biosynthesis glycosyl transferase WcaI|nr:glycosyltransferase family 4 protein [Opitutales bacterium]
MPSPKNFLIITQVFSPDPAAVGQYFGEAAQAIVGTGAKVTVLTANRGYDNPDKQFAAKEDRDGIQIRRLPLSSFGKASIPVRIFAQLSFLIQCILRGLFTPKLTDLLVSTSPPMAAITAVIIGFFRPKLKVHYWVMDINPDQAVVLGAFGPRHPLVLALDWLNRRILKRADSIIALDRFMVERMEAKLTRPEAELRRPITIIPPWPMDDYLEAVPHSENQFRKEQRWEDKFVVMYSGNHSLVHPLDTILDAAEALRDDPRFLFAFIGGGKGKQAVEDRVAELNIESCSLNEGSATTNNKQQTTSNLISLPYQPLDQIRYSLSAADLHIVSLGNNMSGIVHPCKIYGALSIGRPVLTLGPKVSYLSDMIESRGLRSEIGETARIGWSIEHGDVDAAVAALKEAADQTQQARTTIGQSAEEVARERFSREQLVAQFLDIVLR